MGNFLIWFIFLVLVHCTKKHLATLSSCFSSAANKLARRNVMPNCPEKEAWLKEKRIDANIGSARYRFNQAPYISGENFSSTFSENFS
jgi:hypothetical protein